VRGLACALSTICCALAAAPAGADTLSLDAGPDPARDSTPVTVHVAGETAAAQPSVAIYQQLAAGQGCPASATAGDPAFPFVAGGAVAGGSFSADYGVTFAPGTVVLCGYVGASGAPPAAAATHSLVVRPLRVVLALAVSPRVEAGEAFRGDVSFQGLPVTAEVALWVDVKPDDGRSCAATRAAEPAEASDLLGPGDIGHTFGGSFASYGRRIVCAWLVRHDGSTLAGPASATIAVVHITGGRRLRGSTSQRLAIAFRRLGHTLYGTTLKLSARCADGTRVRRRVTAGPIVLAHGRFSVPLAGAQGRLRGRATARAAHGTVRAAFANSAGAPCRTGRVTWRARRR
jgi:hypothetical protein